MPIITLSSVTIHSTSILKKVNSKTLRKEWPKNFRIKKNGLRKWECRNRI